MMRWTDALCVAPVPEQSHLPVTIVHRSGSYQEVYSNHTYIYPAGSGTGYRTARTSVVQNILNEFDLNDNGWYAPVVFHKKPRVHFLWLSRIFAFFARRKTHVHQRAGEEATQ